MTRFVHSLAAFAGGWWTLGLYSCTCMVPFLYNPTTVKAWLPAQHRLVPRRSLPVSTRLESSSSSSIQDYHDKTIYQRIFYRFSPDIASDVAVPKSVVIEERTRYELDRSRTDGHVIPTGHCTLVLHENDDDDEDTIGRELYTLTVQDGHPTHRGMANREAAIVLALYLASNPALCHVPSVLQLGSELGIGGLLGCIGAAHVQHRLHGGTVDTQPRDIADDILTIAQPSSSISDAQPSGLWPAPLELLSLTECREDQLEMIVDNVRVAGVPGHKVRVEALDWTVRPLRTVRPAREYTTVLAADVADGYPQAKELARTVAHRVEPSSRSSDSVVPCFVHLSPDTRTSTGDLQRLLSQGYRMHVTTGYLSIEKLIFQVQVLPQTTPESALDDDPLELKDSKELIYESLTAMHHPDYMGEGSGDMFFPMATGEYDGSSSSSYLEREPGASPW
jgi:hypothetical protein